MVSDKPTRGPVSGLLGRDVLVIEQKPKFVELTNEYRVLDEAGGQIGVIRQEGQSKARKLLRLVSSIDQFLTHRLSMYDASGAKVLDIVRPTKVLKSRLQILDGMGTERGWIVQENVVRKKQFSLQGFRGERIGSIHAENWRSWDFAIRDAGGDEVGRITKRWAGILREGFTTADRYLLHIAAEVPPDLRLLMVASAAGIDTALKQDDTGGFGFGGLDLDV
ncbi:MAG: phospholipid scramblase-related protein [Gemmatimonadota bacterium]